MDDFWQKWQAYSQKSSILNFVHFLAQIKKGPKTRYFGQIVRL